ncbi:MAG: epoxide hydrolase family protein [Gammaproteobacteria bacterium]
MENLTVHIDDSDLLALRARLRATQWAPEYANEDWRYGTYGAYLRELVDYWIDGYDWRAQEAAINAFEHRRVDIDGIPIHFIREPGRGDRPVPLVLTHGWPWTFWDMHRVIGPLADPAAHGGDPADAFDVIVPSLPGYGFSSPLRQTGVNFHRTADLWVKLMREVLGYGRFAAQGGDWGAFVTGELGHRHADKLIGIHLTNMIPLDVFSGATPYNIARRRSASHVAVHMLDPQTLSWALHDSPVGLAAWLLERRRAWGDCNGDVETRFSKDHLITTTMIYWHTRTFATSIRYYAEAMDHPWKPAHARTPVVEAPTGLSFFEPDSGPGPTDWQRGYFNIHYTRSHPRGGHFAPMEEPEALVEDIRATFRSLR